jgi:hypothetical protein
LQANDIGIEITQHLGNAVKLGLDHSLAPAVPSGDELLILRTVVYSVKKVLDIVAGDLERFGRKRASKKKKNQ